MRGAVHNSSLGCWKQWMAAIALAACPLYAQRGSHTAQGFHSSAFVPGRSIAAPGFASSRLFAATPPVSASPPAAPFPGMPFAANSFGLGTFNRRPERPGRGGDRDDFHRGFHRHPIPPFGAFLEPYYFLPFIDYGFGDFDTDNGYQSNAAAYQSGPSPDEVAAEMNQEQLADRLQRLQDEVANLELQQHTPLPPSAPLLVPQYSPQPESAEPEQPPITLVLRSGQQVKVRDYAIMNRMFWDFTSQRVRKIPLSSIDIAASQRATEAYGGEFPAITAAE
jgi:hypothetical protein